MTDTLKPQDQPFPSPPSIHLNITGSDRYQKVSYPIRYGRYSEIQTDRILAQFNLNDEIRFIQLRNSPHMEPTEWLKRTLSNDWVFYSSGGYNGAYDIMGEHYIPCFSYPNNGIIGGAPFERGVLDEAIGAIRELKHALSTRTGSSVHPETTEFIDRLLNQTDTLLAEKASRLHAIIGGHVPVLPPDTRHVDYDVIPLSISTGCLYNCRFCRVKTNRPFTVLSRNHILDQIEKLKCLVDRDLVNFNSLFLGQNDALNAGADVIEFAALSAYDRFRFSSSAIRGCNLFLFGSVEALLNTTPEALETINRLPYHTYINIGFESSDDATLSRIGKPLDSQTVSEGFSAMVSINRTYPNIEITGNFLIGDALPTHHMDRVLDLVSKTVAKPYGKGALYFSPFGPTLNKKQLVKTFRLLKNRCRLPAFLYIIQRL